MQFDFERQVKTGDLKLDGFGYDDENVYFIEVKVFPRVENVLKGIMIKQIMHRLRISIPRIVYSLRKRIDDVSVLKHTLMFKFIVIVVLNTSNDLTYNTNNDCYQSEELCSWTVIISTIDKHKYSK